MKITVDLEMDDLKEILFALYELMGQTKDPKELSAYRSLWKQLGGKEPQRGK